MPNFEGAVFQGHGVHDEVISISDARNLNAQLSHFGERYEYHEYAMGHSICDEELSDLNQWIAKFLNVK
jgi:phospholipase/carboxylesterase